MPVTAPGFSNVAMRLPQELTDMIIGYLPSNDQSLRNCSLVAKSWTYPSQRRLFDTVNFIFASDPDFKLWRADVSPTNTELLQHVRSLYPVTWTAHHPRREPVDLVEFFRDFSFPQLRNLYLCFEYLPESLPRTGAFSAFQRTLEHLFLFECTIGIDVLVSLINCFPNLVHLNLYCLNRRAPPPHSAGNQPIPPPLARPLRKLTVTHCYTGSALDLLCGLLELQPQCDEVSIGVPVPAAPSRIQRAINCVEASVKHLDLNLNIKYINEPLTLSNCRQLRELKIRVSPADSAELNIISSITSENIRKITLAHSHTFRDYPVGHTYWARLDNSLCRSVDQLGYRHLPEVEFQADEMQGKKLDFWEYLPRFCEKGEVRIVARKD